MTTNVAPAQTIRLKQIIRPNCTLGMISDSVRTEKPSAMDTALVKIAGPVDITALFIASSGRGA